MPLWISPRSTDSLRKISWIEWNPTSGSPWKRACVPRTKKLPMRSRRQYFVSKNTFQYRNCPNLSSLVLPNIYMLATPGSFLSFFKMRTIIASRTPTRKANLPLSPSRFIRTVSLSNATKMDLQQEIFPPFAQSGRAPSQPHTDILGLRESDLNLFSSLHGRSTSSPAISHSFSNTRGAT